MKAVKFDEYGGIDVLQVMDVPRPVPGAGQVLVQVKAAGINPGEAKIREGLLDALWPATFPSGEGSDLAGIVAETGPGVTSFSAGDELIGWTDNRASQAEYVVVEEQHLTAKPGGVPWPVAGALFVAGPPRRRWPRPRTAHPPPPTARQPAWASGAPAQPRHTRPGSTGYRSSR